MADNVLEQYIVQHITASTDDTILFSWHGGEPTLAGLNYFRRIVDLQQKHKPAGSRIINGIQTNGTLINEAWAQFFASEQFLVGISIDGPDTLHNPYRVTRNRQSTHEKTVRGYRLLQQHGVSCEILCVVNAINVQFPLKIYHYFKQLDAKYITFLPNVVQQKDSVTGVSRETVPSDEFGIFISTIIDEWIENDIGKIKIQIFEEAARTAFNQDHTLCIFKVNCGGVPVVEHNGDFYSCDHYVSPEYLVGNIKESSLADLLDSDRQKAFGLVKSKTLPRYCLECEVRSMCNGECPKNRFIKTPDGEPGLNYLCTGYKMFFNHCRPFVEAIAAAWGNSYSDH